MYKGSLGCRIASLLGLLWSQDIWMMAVNVCYYLQPTCWMPLCIYAMHEIQYAVSQVSRQMHSNTIGKLLYMFFITCKEPRIMVPWGWLVVTWLYRLGCDFDTRQSTSGSRQHSLWQWSMFGHIVFWQVFSFSSTPILIDSQSAIIVAWNLVFHACTKHIEIYHNYLEGGYMQKKSTIPIHENIACIFAKALASWEVWSMIHYH